MIQSVVLLDVYCEDQKLSDKKRRLLLDTLLLLHRVQLRSGDVRLIKPQDLVRHASKRKRHCYLLQNGFIDFMEHVMSHAPGYQKLMNWTDVDIMPTPLGEGMAMQYDSQGAKP